MLVQRVLACGVVQVRLFLREVRRRRRLLVHAAACIVLLDVQMVDW